MPLADDLLADLATCLRFFSRLPIPRLGRRDDPSARPDLTRSAGLIPVAGVLLTLPAALLGALLSASDLPPAIVGVLVVALQAAVTGALHEDGLADLFDGFFGGPTVERRLSIMKDSRIGVFGGTALGLVILLRVLSAAALAEIGAAALISGLLASAAVSRAMMVAVWHRLPPARPDGLSRSVGQPGEAATATALAIGLIGAAPAVAVLAPASLALGLGLAFSIAAATARLARAKIGGQTGDVLGAVEQLATCGFLVGLLL